MSTFSPSSPTLYFPCQPDAFALFRRGDKVLCIVECGNSDWLLSPPPRKGQVYVVRDYHWGHAVSPKGDAIYGQILNLEGVVCDRVAMVGGVEWGFHACGFRKVTEAEALEAASAQVGIG